MKKTILILLFSVCAIFAQAQAQVDGNGNPVPTFKQDLTTVAVDSASAQIVRALRTLYLNAVTETIKMDSIKAAVNRGTAQSTSLQNQSFASNGTEFVTDALKHTYAFIGILAVDSCRIDTLFADATAPVTGNTLRDNLLQPGYHPVHGTAIRFMRATKVYLIKK